MSDSLKEQWASTPLFGANASAVESLYEQFLEQPGSVPDGWREYFETFAGPDVEIAHSPIRDQLLRESRSGRKVGQVVKRSADTAASSGEKQAAVSRLIQVYSLRGHQIADLDPLGLMERPTPGVLKLDYLGLAESDMDTDFYTGGLAGNGNARMKLRDILAQLQNIYCRKIGAEFAHISRARERLWLRKRFELGAASKTLSDEERLYILDKLTCAEGIERYLHTRYVGQKRFSLEGGESLIPLLDDVIQQGGAGGVKEIVIGMAHRGRINVLVNIFGKSPEELFEEFEGEYDPGEMKGSGDVKYHKGFSADMKTPGGNVHIALAFNPSHLEIVNPVVEGSVRARQQRRGDTERDDVLPLLIHGDAAFAGQGIVPESLDLSQIKGYRTGGTIHVVVNNQIGFTTNPSSSRSTPYPTDIAKGMQAPIFHVNGDDPEAVVRVADLAAQFRQKFKRDVIVDLFCYRRHGHNEGDEPMFTQPKMYTAIAKHPTTREIYRKKLIKEELITLEEIERVEATFRSHLDDEFEAAPNYKTNKADWLEGKWEGLSALEGEEEKRDDNTYVELNRLKEIGHSLARVPEEVNVNNKLIRQLKAKSIMMDTGEGIDWAMAEALAYGSLLMEGHPVRLSGQDSGRGTFSHRHAVITDQENENRYFPLSQINPSKQAPFEVMDSPLSEFAVLGYEYGYSLAEPETLTIWEAQFGDFANTAQVIFDQFIASGESKWLRMSGLVMLLPHGMEGQGPEHSSARLERFLQLCAEDNLQVVNITSPANFFHALRRQVKRNFRKPLIVMSPKSLLRHKLNISRLNEMGPGTGFCRIIPEIDTLQEDSEIKRVILCSGKVYFDLLEARRQQNIKDVVIIRVEQLYPWPRGSITEQISKYSNADVVWSQEEPSNQGSWHFVSDRLNYILSNLDQKTKRRRNVIYVGRRASASPATGALKIHNKEQAFLIDQALNGKESDIVQPYIPIK